MRKLASAVMAGAGLAVLSCSACNMSCEHAVRCCLNVHCILDLFVHEAPVVAGVCCKILLSLRVAVLFSEPALTPAGVHYRYEPFMVAEASMSSGQQPDAADAARAGSDAGPSGGAAGGRSSFRTLAGYIFGKNQEERKMAMTMPVLSDSIGHMQFYMGSQHQVRGVFKNLRQG